MSQTGGKGQRGCNFRPALTTRLGEKVHLKRVPLSHDDSLICLEKRLTNPRKKEASVAVGAEYAHVWAVSYVREDTIEICLGETPRFQFWD